MPSHTLATVKRPSHVIAAQIATQIAAQIAAGGPQSPAARHAQSIAGRLIRQLSALIRSAIDRRLRANRILQAEHHLSMLPDHLLRDIGVSRTDIRFITRHGR
jgi:uncharacterized protein YjiS (DUF1127 family)